MTEIPHLTLGTFSGMDGGDSSSSSACEIDSGRMDGTPVVGDKSPGIGTIL
jgi:hypothetical protein